MQRDTAHPPAVDIEAISFGFHHSSIPHGEFTGIGQFTFLLYGFIEGDGAAQALRQEAYEASQA